MAQRKVNTRDRQIGKKPQQQKKHLIDPRYKNTFWTVVILVIMTIFFIINNTREVSESGPYPPYYKKGASGSNNQLNYGYDKSN